MLYRIIQISYFMTRMSSPPCNIPRLLKIRISLLAVFIDVSRSSVLRFNIFKPFFFLYDSVQCSVSLLDGKFKIGIKITTFKCLELFKLSHPSPFPVTANEHRNLSHNIPLFSVQSGWMEVIKAKRFSDFSPSFPRWCLLHINSNWNPLTEEHWCMQKKERDSLEAQNIPIRSL